MNVSLIVGNGITLIGWLGGGGGGGQIPTPPRLNPDSGSSDN